MPLPSNSSLLGLDYGYDGESFIAIPAKAGVVYGTDVEGFNGEEFFFSADAAATDARLTSLLMAVLVNSPGSTPANLTALRAAVLRTSDIADADRRLTALRMGVLMSSPTLVQARLTALRLSVLRTNRRGNVARPGVWSRVALADVIPAPLRNIYGYNTFASQTLGQLGTRVGGVSLYPVESGGTYEVWGGGSLPISPTTTYASGLTGLLQAFTNLYPSGQAFHNNPDPGSGLYTSELRWVDGTEDFFGGTLMAPVGILWGNPAYLTNIWNDGSGTNTGLGRVGPGYALEKAEAVGASFWAPPLVPEDYFGTPSYYPTTFVFKAFNATLLNTGGLPAGVDEALIWKPDEAAEVAGSVSGKVAPFATLALRMGQGAYRVVPGTFRDFAKVTNLLPPLRFTALDPAPFEALYGNQYGSPEELMAALSSATPTQDPLFASPTPGTTLTKVGSNWPVTVVGWGPLWRTSVGPTSQTVLYARDDGAYVTADGTVRFRRRKTLVMTQNLAAKSPTTGASFHCADLTPSIVMAEDLEYGVLTAAARASNALGPATAPASEAEITDLIDRLMAAGFNFAVPDDSQFGLLTAVMEGWLADIGQSGLFAAFVETLAVTIAPTVVSPLTARGRVNLKWDDPDIDPTLYQSDVTLPCIVVEKMDSPSTHFDDPPGTPGVDD